MTTRVQLKKNVLLILQGNKLDEIFEKISPHDPQRLLNPLFSALCHPEEKVRWHAVLCFGRVVTSIAEHNIESARIVMRRFLWSLNDESGGIGWGVPEAMAEVMCHCCPLRKEYLHMLVSYMREDGEELFQDGNYLELPMLQRGLLWGIGQLCKYHREEMLDLQVIDDVAAYLDSKDFHVQGQALCCLEHLGAAISRNKIDALLSNTQEVSLFVDYRMEKYTIGQLANRLLTG